MSIEATPISDHTTPDQLSFLLANRIKRGIPLLGCPLYSNCGHHTFSGHPASQPAIRSSGNAHTYRNCYPGHQRRQRCGVVCAPFADRSRSCRWACTAPLAARSYEWSACRAHPLASGIAWHRRYVASHHGRDRSFLLLLLLL